MKKCKNECGLDPTGKFCKGCDRTIEEIIAAFEKYLDK